MWEWEGAFKPSGRQRCTSGRLLNASQLRKCSLSHQGKRCSYLIQPCLQTKLFCGNLGIRLGLRLHACRGVAGGHHHTCMGSHVQCMWWHGTPQRPWQYRCTKIPQNNTKQHILCQCAAEAPEMLTMQPILQLTSCTACTRSGRLLDALTDLYQTFKNNLARLSLTKRSRCRRTSSNREHHSPGPTCTPSGPDWHP